MSLTDTFVKNVKPVKAKGDKHADGDGMYLLVTPTGKYWRLYYRFLGKRKTLALGVYPDTSLAKARMRRADARELLADGVDPAQAKRETKRARRAGANQTFETVARTWLEKTVALRAATTQEKVTAYFEHDVFPVIGSAPIATLKPRDVLLCVQRIEARGALDTALRVKQICGQVFRYAVDADMVERDVTADLKGALSVPTKTSYAAITDPTQAGALMRSIYGYSGHPYAVAASQPSSCQLFSSCAQENCALHSGRRWTSTRLSGGSPARK
jgi:hypothetical protein